LDWQIGVEGNNEDSVSEKKVAKSKNNADDKGCN